MNDYKVIFVWVHPDEKEDFAGELIVRGATFNDCVAIGEAIIADSGLVVIDYYTDNEF